MASPIADLSYRNYDGPLDPPLNRWWAIAKTSMRLSVKKKGFWLWASITGYWYLILLAIFYFADQSTQVGNAVGRKNPFFSNIIWKDLFVNAFSVSQLFFLILALLIGAGAIANDNRANALLVYLSKPCTKLDYVMGKWLGIFIPLTLVMAAPTLVFYAYCLLSYRSYGFLSQDPWLILKLLGLIFVPGALHASLALGVSSMFQQGRLAGATYAGLYFFGVFFTKAMQSIGTVGAFGGGDGPSETIKSLYYCSVDGIQIALAKVILHTDGSQLIPGQPPSPIRFVMPAPSGWIFVPAFLGICALSLLLAWSRIKAVEVVG
jgi:ABC-2 type transport system permease protein